MTDETDRETFKPLLDAIEAASWPVFFTGAGVSTLCGIPDFRGPDGVYRDPDAVRMFDIDLFDEDPSFFYRHAAALVYGLDGTLPGPVHKALFALQHIGKCKAVITQNIDCLHERAGSNPVFAVHGSAKTHRCRGCGATETFERVQSILSSNAPGFVPRCNRCGGVMKPDITFFGEALPQDAFSGAVAAASKADLVVVLGSSLVVQPAASIPPMCLRTGGRLAIVNRGETPLDRLAFFKAEDLASFAEHLSKRFSLA